MLSPYILLRSHTCFIQRHKQARLEQSQNHLLLFEVKLDHVSAIKSAARSAHLCGRGIYFLRTPDVSFEIVSTCLNSRFEDVYHGRPHPSCVLARRETQSEGNSSTPRSRQPTYPRNHGQVSLFTVHGYELDDRWTKSGGAPCRTRSCDIGPGLQVKNSSSVSIPLLGQRLPYYQILHSPIRRPHSIRK